VRLLGENPLQADPELRAKVGIMLQDGGLPNAMHPIPLLEHISTMYTDPYPVEELAERLGIDAFNGTTIRRLSGGQKQRVSLAAALIGRPDVLFLDEPASGLDLAGREQLLAALTEIISSPDSPSMVLVTHHLEEIPEGFTHALTLREGKVVGSGPLQEVLTADTISTTFGMPLEVTYDRGRYAARGLPAGHGRRVAEARG